MYDFSFTITYDVGADEYTDQFIDRESLRSEALYACLDPSKMWVLELVTGDPEDLAAVDELLLDESLDRYSVSGRSCKATRQVNQITDRSRQRMTYTYVSDVSYCDAIPLIAVKYFSDGVLFRRTRSGETAQWHVLVQDDENVGMLYDTVSGRLADGLQFSFDHLTELEQWESRLLSPSGIRAEQREVLTAAVNRGYFETPREITLDELATELGLPRSTVSYRLRRATAELAKAFVDQEL
ncbi:helix-turn-helix domain-containing protein [Halobellus rarus]|uniref:Helix-turn-helix domain-containing protein n=1 Tax=Halobellus rarus TaxID=1126237 RepID=A0ABD6CI12_9EURY|nr:helix-turn-helix domain-containing protein [Halobellus rarus]